MDLMKHYHEHDIPGAVFLDTFFSSKSEKLVFEELVKFPMEQIYKALDKGYVSGDTLAEISVGPMLCHLFPFCDYFKDITVLESNESSVKDLKKWLYEDTDAYDWSHATAHLTELEGCSDDCRKKEEKLRKLIKRILTFDLKNENPTYPVTLEKVDCLFCAGGVDILSKSKDELTDNLIKITSLLKVGGHFIYFGGLNMTYYMVGEHKFFNVTYDEEFLRKTLEKIGYVIEHVTKMKRQEQRTSIDYESVVFIIALKKSDFKK
ncbi:indolethylamine N-methyltransferase-like isoform X1 [Bombina bombina]|uniref:indolethylamine N-methyltransferase-like isoform X1 n=1 Tax=Bombina bombina TaxID=8345 RepID=UPI00235AAE85|nr:indolethylamine N-methyltransferase-like isoform X1 [Bombina bombina]